MLIAGPRFVTPGPAVAAEERIDIQRDRNM